MSLTESLKRIRENKAKQADVDRIERMVSEFSEVLKAIKMIEGKVGEKGDQGEKGDKGDQGVQGIKGPRGDKGFDGKLGKDGRDGRDGNIEKPEEIKSKLESLGLSLFDLSTLKDIIKEAITDTFSIKDTDKGISIVQSRRSKAYFKPLTITGTKNGVNKEFYLSEAPKYGTQLFVFMNGQWLSDDDYTITTGQTLTLGSQTPAPDSTWNLYAIAFKP